MYFESVCERGKMSKPIIYLGGAISDLTQEQYRGWRDKLATNIEVATNYKWRCFDPCEHLNEFGEVITLEESAAYDLDHLRHCRLMIASFEYTQKSTGTLIELGVAYENRIPIIGYNPDNLELLLFIFIFARQKMDYISFYVIII